jgi:hypothetical protein
MRKGYLIVALGLSATAGTAVADVVSVPETANTPAMTVPAKGTSMSEVIKKFGEPRNKRPTVGGDTPKHPPITRWDYDAFVVIFEKDRVVDAVVPGAPPKLRTMAGLTPATNAPPAPSMPAAEAPPPDMPPPPEAEPVIPEAPQEEPAPPMEPTAAAPTAEPTPPPAEQPPPAAPPPAQRVEPAPVQSPVPADEYGEGPPTPK